MCIRDSLVSPRPGGLAARVAEPRIALYEQGYLSWGRPDLEELGEYSAGMLGTLPDFLAAVGLRPRLVPELGADALAETDALLLVNQDHALDAESAGRVEDFVRGGGTLIVVGDHTFLHEAPDGEGPELFLNQPLEPAAIRFANDSADPIAPGWISSTVLPAPGISLNAEPRNPSGILVGGGLQLRWPAVPLVVGRHGYLDAGVEERRQDGRGWLGDLAWNPGERLGDVVVAAAQELGRGTVIAVGDTTGLTNLGRVSRWAFWARLFRGELGPPRAWRGLQLAALLIALLLAALQLARRRGPGWVLPAVLAAGLAAATAPPRAPAASAFSGTAEAPPLAIVDTAPLPPGRLHSWERDGLLTLPVSLHLSLIHI